MPIDKGDTAWVLICTAFVLLMTAPGLALFYGGMVRQRNVLATLLQSFVALALISIQWVLFVYSLAFGPDHGGLIGGLDWIGLRGVGPGPSSYAPTIPHQAFMLFQMMFAVITPALITGAFAERKKFAAYLLFTLLWATLVYDPLAHWVGWFGFNAGSALEASGLAANAFLATNSGAAAGALAWMFAEWFLRGKPTALGTASGAVAGLVVITPACGFVGPLAAIIIGGIGGALCFSACHLKSKLGYDDSLDVVGVHGVGGVWGALATGLFAWKAINGAGADGLFHGNPGQRWTQLVAVLVTIALAAPMTFVILKIVDAVVGIRVSADDEASGLDLSQHSENAYAISGSVVGETVSSATGNERMRTAEGAMMTALR